MRIGETSDEDLALLKSRCINKLSKNYPHDACHLYYTNKEVNDHNNQKINKLKSKLHQAVLLGDYPRGYKPKISSYGTIDDTGLKKVLKISIFTKRARKTNESNCLTNTFNPIHLGPGL